MTGAAFIGSGVMVQERSAMRLQTMKMRVRGR